MISNGCGTTCLREDDEDNKPFMASVAANDFSRGRFRLDGKLRLKVLMDLDINIEAHDLLWRLMEPTIKKRYTESFGTRKSELVESEMLKLVRSGLVKVKDGQHELTPKGQTLYNLLAKKKGCCQPM